MATPIGNLRDITFRAIDTLKKVNLIACEDTRRTRKLLQAYSITTPLASLREHNEPRKSEKLIEKIEEGWDIAYVSDAGTPGITDPGHLLVDKAVNHGITVIPIPGPCAAVAAVSISGLTAQGFIFFGFLPSRREKKREFLKGLTEERKISVFYEAPHRLKETLEDIKEILGERKLILTRELTKVHEEVIRGCAADIMEIWQDKKIKGEITIVLAGCSDKASNPTKKEIGHLIAQLLRNGGLSTRDLAKKIASELKISKKLAYEEVIAFLQSESPKK